MSSIISIEQTDAVHIITDSAIYGADGVVRRFKRKVVELPLSNCVFVLRGADYPCTALSLLLFQYDSLDAIMNNIPKHMQQMLAVFDQLNEGDIAPIHRHFQVTVAGWSDDLNSWAAGIASTYEACDPNDVTGISYLTGYQPFIPYQGAPAYCVPAVESAVLGRDIVTQEDIDGFDPERDGLLLIQAQRLTPVIDGAFQVQYLVGGSAELVTLSAQGVSRKILCEWPDECGQLITPEGAPSRNEVKAWVAEQQALAMAQDYDEPELIAA